MPQRSPFQVITAAALVGALTACSPAHPAATSGKKTIVTTYAILGAVVQELVGTAFDVKTEIPNGLDLHEWEPSARDIETLMTADLVVENGLGLEGGMQKALAQARQAGVPFFTASDHIAVRRVGAGEGVPSGDADQASGARDPHLRTDPLSIKAVVDALAVAIRKTFGVDLSARAAAMDARLTALDAEIRGEVEAVPPDGGSW